MPVAIRLSRIGTKHKPFYRVVVVDSRKKRDGAVIENIGTYDGLKSAFVRFEDDRYDAWIKQGAQPSDTVKRLYRLFKRSGSSVAKTEAAPAPAKKAAPKKKEKTTEEAVKADA